MKPKTVSLKLNRSLLLALPVVAMSNSAFAQDHSAHSHAVNDGVQGQETHQEAETLSEHDHGSSHDMSMHSADVPMSTQDDANNVRDPHAYSGGYRRDSGPYSLPASQQLHLADEELFNGVWVDRLESRNGDAEDFQEFQGEVWIGDSYQRALLRTELELREQTIEESKTELLYRRAITPFWNLEVGGRYDHGDNEHREWFALGVSGLAPYWFELSATAYIGPEGHSAATIEAEYDLYLTQRLILQPKAELDFYGDSDLEAGHGKGLSKSLLGFRLRYDYDRQFSPYVGYERVHRHGETTTVFEPLGQHREGQWIAGFRFWF